VIEDPEFVTVDDVLDLHWDQIERYGGDPGIRDHGLIEAAVAMPRQSFGGQFLHVDLFEMAAAYAFHLAKSQAFLDGNERAPVDQGATVIPISAAVTQPSDRPHTLDAAPRNLQATSRS
jgi:prophage maintenance system killer protein